MRGLRAGAVPWYKTSVRDVSTHVIPEAPEDSYDIAKAAEVKTTRTKPRSIALANFSKQRPRDDLLHTQTDALANVLLENTREQREFQIQAKREQHKRYLNLGLM